MDNSLKLNRFVPERFRENCRRFVFREMSSASLEGAGTTAIPFKVWYLNPILFSAKSETLPFLNAIRCDQSRFLHWLVFVRQNVFRIADLLNR
jgi:hypothetical protein